MYDPAIGRWHCQDPLEQFISPYLYAANNPVIMIDPSGMWADDIFPDDPGKTPPSGLSPLELDKWKHNNLSPEEIEQNQLNLLGKPNYYEAGPGGGDSKKESRKAKRKAKRESRKTGATLSVVGVGLVQIGEAAPGFEARYATALITQDGTIVTVPTQSAYNRFMATGKYTLPSIKKYSSVIAANAKKLGIVGKTAGAAGNLVAVYSIGSGYVNYRNGKISGETFALNTASTSVGVIVGASVSGVAGPILGIVAGVSTEYTYRGVKAVHNGMWNWTNNRFNPTNWKSYYNLGF